MSDEQRVRYRLGDKREVAALLEANHYLGPIRSGKVTAVVVGEVEDEVVAAQVWRPPTSRRLPSDGTWLELSRWCLTEGAGTNAGSRQHAAAIRLLASIGATTLVGYSDPSQGHTGALYRACNWRWSPTWQRLRPPPTGAGCWGTEKVQHVKDRWVFPVGRDERRGGLLMIKDRGAIRFWLRTASERDVRLASRSLATDLASAAQEVGR